MNDKRIKALSQLIEQMSRQMHAASHREELYPAQWAALRYFANSPTQNCTVVALARYQGAAVPPVFRSVGTLIAKGLIQKVGRIPGQKTEIIAVTSAGFTMLKKDPILRINAALETVDPVDFDAAARIVEAIILVLSTSSTPNLTGGPKP